MFFCFEIAIFAPPPPFSHKRAWPKRTQTPAAPIRSIMEERICLLVEEIPNPFTTRFYCKIPGGAEFLPSTASSLCSPPLLAFSRFRDAFCIEKDSHPHAAAVFSCIFSAKNELARSTQPATKSLIFLFPIITFKGILLWPFLFWSFVSDVYLSDLCFPTLFFPFLLFIFMLCWSILFRSYFRFSLFCGGIKTP